MLNHREKEELKKAARSNRLRFDMQELARRRYNPFLVNGDVDLDRYVTFLTEYNYFINHAPRLFRKVTDKDMRL
ncbi:MAG: hypothetical protein HY350_01590 [Candidatus Omnitrophica bacterium]|nr:hypothetical protein [Candidatus Omnitrophota bacterium]